MNIDGKTLDSLIGLIRLSPRNAIVLSIIGATSFALFRYVYDFSQILELVSLLAAVTGLGNLSADVIMAGHGKMVRWSKRRAGLSRLQMLTPNEKELLQRFIARNSRTIQLSLTSGVAKKLSENSIVYRNLSGPVHPHSADLHISNWAWDYLKESPHLLTMTDEEQSVVSYPVINGSASPF